MAVSGDRTFYAAERRLKAKGFQEWEASITAEAYLAAHEPAEIVMLAQHPETHKWFVFRFKQGQRELVLVTESMHETSARREYDALKYDYNSPR